MVIFRQLFLSLLLALPGLLKAAYEDEKAAVESLGAAAFKQGVPSMYGDDTIPGPVVATVAGETRYLFFDALEYRGAPTRVFAWIGIPAGASPSQPVPGIVLVHGGGGSAFRDWVTKWVDKGFAAIAIDVEGRANYGGGLSDERAAHAMAGPVRVGIFGDTTEPITDQWLYHAVADTILANSLLRSIPGVDASKVGLMGISWGGVIASTVMGLDDRFAFAIPVYGCGDLHTIPNQYGRALGENTVYQEVWNSRLRIGRAQMPALWLSWPNENNFSLDSQAATYRAAPGPRLVSLIPGMGHGHPPAWNPPDSYAFAESVVQAGASWCRQESLEQNGNSVTVTFQSTKPLQQARLIYSTETGYTGSRQWTETSATLLDVGQGKWTASASLPSSTTGWFINVLADGLVGSSDYEEASVVVEPRTISFGVTEGVWNDPTNWNVGSVPTDVDTVIINNSRTAVLPQSVEATAATLRVGNQNHATHFGRLEVAGHLTVTGNLQVATAANSTGHLEQTAGTVTFAKNFQVAAINSGSVATYRIAGGRLETETGSVVVGTVGQAEWHIDGSNAVLAVGSVELGANSTLRFTLDAAGVSPLRAGGAVAVSSGARLIVERGTFQWNRASELLLIEASSLPAFWPGDAVELIGFGQDGAELRFTAEGLVLAGQGDSTPVVRPEGPNVVIFLADDLGWQDTQLNQVGTPCPWETPNVERLAAMGLNFPQAYAPAPTCAPSRVALMTGKHPARNGLTHVSGGQPPVGRSADTYLDPYYPGRMQLEEITLAEALRDHGYATGHVGKWHMAVNHNAFPGPLDQGFTWSSRSRGVTTRMQPDRLSDFATDSPSDPYRLGADGRPFDQTTEDALAFMDQHKEQPFFLYLAHWLVHWPVQTRHRALLEYYCDKLGIPFPSDAGAVTTPGQTNPYYGAMVDTLDWSLGRLLDYLETTDDPRHPGQKLIANTYIVFTSDNGGALKHATEVITSNAPLDMGKTSAKEGGIRVPFVIAGPGIAGGEVSQEPINLLDLYPTFLSLTGAPGDAGQMSQFDGTDLSAYLIGEASDVTHADGTPRDTLYWHYPHILELHSAIRKGDFKLLRNYETENYELYRLYNEDGSRADWGEALNLSGNASWRELRNSLAGELEAFLSSVGADFPHRNPNYRSLSELPGHDQIPIFLSKSFDATDGMAMATFETGPQKSRVTRVDLLYTPNGGDVDEEWFKVPATFDADLGWAKAPVPGDATHFLFNLVDENNFLVSSEPLVHGQGASPRVRPPDPRLLRVQLSGGEPRIAFQVPSGMQLQGSNNLRDWLPVSDWAWQDRSLQTHDLSPALSGDAALFFRLHPQ